jgi:hypothetical protein
MSFSVCRSHRGIELPPVDWTLPSAMQSSFCYPAPHLNPFPNPNPPPAPLLACSTFVKMCSDASCARDGNGAMLLLMLLYALYKSAPWAAIPKDQSMANSVNSTLPRVSRSMPQVT